MRTADFGKTKDGKDAKLYILENAAGMEAGFTDFGAAWVYMRVPDTEGIRRNVVAGYDNVSGYETNWDMFGAFVGPIANRTEGGSFVLDSVKYQMEINDGKNNLHTSVTNGIHKQMWKVVDNPDLSDDGESITFNLRIPDMTYGIPGNLEINLTYTLSQDGQLIIEARTVSDKKTVINFTHHAYFNLDGICSRDCLKNELSINADFYTPVMEGGLPTGELLPVEGTAFDFKEMKLLGKDFFNQEPQQQIIGGGYDHTFVINGNPNELRKASEAFSITSGIKMTTYINKPAIQLYTGNFIGDVTGRGGVKLSKYGGFCLEIHKFTNAINTPGFPSPVVQAFEEDTTKVIYKFEKKQLY